MQTRLNLLPGQRGTKKLIQTYGDQFVCVRYRYDEERKKRYKTVELIVDEIPLDNEFAEICMYKSQAWIDPDSWDKEKIEQYGIDIEFVQKRYKDMLLG